MEGKRTKALIDSGAQLSQITKAYVRFLGIPIRPIKSAFTLEGAGGIQVPYEGFVEANLKMPDVQAFDEPFTKTSFWKGRPRKS